MKVFSVLLALVMLIASVPVVYAGDGKITHVYTGDAAHLVKRVVELASDQDASIEDIAQALYEALKADPDNAIPILEEVLDARPDWTPSDLILIVDTTIIAVPDIPVDDLKDTIGDTTGSDDVAEDIIDQTGMGDDGDTPNDLDPVNPPHVPDYPVVPSPGDMSPSR